jgi:thiamine biosynthesis lipoprotein
MYKLVTVFSLFLIFSCNNAVKPKSFSSPHLGTNVQLFIYDNVNEEIFNKAFSLVSFYENKLSKNIATSELTKINLNSGIAPVRVSEDTFFLVKKSIYYSDITNGLFDISIGPLVKLWGIGTETATIPDKYELESAIALVNYKDIDIQKNNFVFLKKTKMSLDMGAIAKGFIAEKVKEFLKNEGVKSAIINLGGNIVLLGNKPDKTSFTIGLQDPFNIRGFYFGTVKTSDISIVTSGVYERYLEKDGIKYHHIINPKTGLPVDNEIMSITVITADSTDADALSTSLFMLGLENALAFTEALENTEVIIVTKDKKIFLSSGTASLFTLVDESFVVQK